MILRHLVWLAFLCLAVPARSGEQGRNYSSSAPERAPEVSESLDRPPRVLPAGADGFLRLAQTPASPKDDPNKAPAPGSAPRKGKGAPLSEEDALFKTGESAKTKEVLLIQRKTALRLGSGDIMQINVKNHPELEGFFTVDAWGFIKLPFVGELQVNGLSKEDLETELERIYSQFIIDPQVLVTVTEYNSRVVFVLGEVRLPGKYPMRDQILTLRDAIVAAGLPTNRAATWRVFVVRQTEEGMLYKHINFSRILYRGHLENNIILQAGDIVYVPMALLDSVVTFVGRIVGPIFGIGRTLATAVATP